MNPAPGAGKTVLSRVAKRLRSFIVWRFGDEWGVWLGKKRLKVHAFRGFQHDSYRCWCCCCCVVDADLRPWTASVGKCVRMESGILNCISIALSMGMVGLSSLSLFHLYIPRIVCLAICSAISRFNVTKGYRCHLGEMKSSLRFKQAIQAGIFTLASGDVVTDISLFLRHWFVEGTFI